MVESSTVDNHDRIFRRIYRLQRQEVCDLLYTCTYLLYTFMGDASFYFFYSSMGDALFFYTTEHVFFGSNYITHIYCKLRQEDTQ